MGSGEYDCSLPDTWPPVCPEYMMHLLYEPACLPEKSTLYLKRLPKKLHEKLSEPMDNNASVGWGLYFQEYADDSTIIGIVFLILFLASLLFLVFWTALKDDIQGASGVSAYIIAVASMVGIWIAMRSKSF